jgi:hypothetical protein
MGEKPAAFGGAQAALGSSQPDFSVLLDLVRSGKAYVKISGAYRASAQAPDYPDAAPLAKALIAANAERIVWGTDRPHPNSDTPRIAAPSGSISPYLILADGTLSPILWLLRNTLGKSAFYAANSSPRLL